MPSKPAQSTLHDLGAKHQAGWYQWENEKPLADIPTWLLSSGGSRSSGGRAAMRYYEALRNIPPSGGGGCHRALLGIANLGRLAQVNRDQVPHDLAAHVHGTRKVSRAEIEAAVTKAFNSPATNAGRFKMHAVVNGERLLNAIVQRGAFFTEAELWESSPVRIDWPPKCDAIEILQRLYRPEEQLFIGMRHDAGAEHVLSVSEWITRLKRGIAISEHIIPNPLSGELGHTKDGKPSYRSDSCVERFRFAVIEFDVLSRGQQIRFWAGAPLPVVALIDSGGKSVHGWIRINAVNADEWTRRVEDKLFALLTAVGADSACKNEARLSRMPGHFRAEKNRWQRVLYLDPAGGQVIP